MATDVDCQILFDPATEDALGLRPAAFAKFGPDPSVDAQGKLPAEV